MTESPLESFSKIYRELILYALAGKGGSHGFCHVQQSEGNHRYYRSACLG